MNDIGKFHLVLVSICIWSDAYSIAHLEIAETHKQNEIAENQM
jgi:hypothetical protein